MPSPFARTGFSLPSGGAETIVWLPVAALIVGLYLVIRRTRIKSREHYLNRAEREAELRKNDPDMKDP
ncbi:MAG: hypothetical protein U9R51_03555 [Actinomycetota bacterium]|nr:hypothetical protein [Actinomycetota bacterium]